MDSGTGPVDSGLEVRRAADRFVTRGPGLTTRHSFSFGDHYDPGNVGFGALQVVNEERVRSGAGYDDHPHADAEIVTWVLSGALVHTGSAGRSGLVHPGLVQRLSAGRGVVHAERNDAYRLDPAGPPEPVHFVQMWLRPDEPGGEPSYAVRPYPVADLAADWLPVASGSHPDAVVRVGVRDATLWATRLAPGVRRPLPAGGRVHLQVARGEVAASDVGLPAAGDPVRLSSGDTVRVTGQHSPVLTGVADAEVLVWVLPR